MKITNVENDGIVYTITKTPNLFEKLFGKKEIKEKYIDAGTYFEYYPNITAFYSFKGELIGPFDGISRVLNESKKMKEIENYLNEKKRK